MVLPRVHFSDYVKPVSSRQFQAKGYALRAFSLLSSDPALAGDRKTLWQKVMDGKVKRHNGQMDVVLALWQHGLLQSS